VAQDLPTRYGAGPGEQAASQGHYSRYSGGEAGNTRPTMANDDKHIDGTPDGPQSPGGSPSDVRRNDARRRFLREGAAAGSGLVIYTIHHQRSFAGAKKVIASSPLACQSLGFNSSKQVKVIDSVNPTQKLDKNGDPVFDKDGNPVYVADKDAFECQ
jgi:hypothetical protein